MYTFETITTAISDLPVSVSMIKNMYIIFHTITKILVEKTLDDCTISGEVIECTLTQEESARLGNGPVQRTVIVITTDGARFERTNDEMVSRYSAKREVLT